MEKQPEKEPNSMLGKKALRFETEEEFRERSRLQLQGSRFVSPSYSIVSQPSLEIKLALDYYYEAQKDTFHIVAIRVKHPLKDYTEYWVQQAEKLPLMSMIEVMKSKQQKPYWASFLDYSETDLNTKRVVFNIALQNHFNMDQHELVDRDLLDYSVMVNKVLIIATEERVMRVFDNLYPKHNYGVVVEFVDSKTYHSRKNIFEIAFQKYSTTEINNAKQSVIAIEQRIRKVLSQVHHTVITDLPEWQSLRNCIVNLPLGQRFVERPGSP